MRCEARRDRPRPAGQCKHPALHEAWVRNRWVEVMLCQVHLRGHELAGSLIRSKLLTPASASFEELRR